MNLSFVIFRGRATFARDSDEKQSTQIRDKLHMSVQVTGDHTSYHNNA